MAPFVSPTCDDGRLCMLGRRPHRSQCRQTLTVITEHRGLMRVGPRTRDTHRRGIPSCKRGDNNLRQNQLANANICRFEDYKITKCASLLLVGVVQGLGLVGSSHLGLMSTRLLTSWRIRQGRLTSSTLHDVDECSMLSNPQRFQAFAVRCARVCGRQRTSISRIHSSAIGPWS